MTEVEMLRALCLILFAAFLYCFCHIAYLSAKMEGVKAIGGIAVNAYKRLRKKYNDTSEELDFGTVFNDDDRKTKKSRNWGDSTHYTTYTGTDFVPSCDSDSSDSDCD